MVTAAAARSRLSRRARRAVDINARKRRDSLRGYPDLHQTHRVPVGGVLDLSQSFPDARRLTTFKLRLDAPTANAPSGPTGTFLQIGATSSLGFDSGTLVLTTGGATFTGPFVAAPKESSEVVLAFRVTDGQARVWVDSDLSIAAAVPTFPYDWHDGGNLIYLSIAGATLTADLDAFDGLPRQFDEAAGQPPVGPTFDPLLFRASRQATDLATSEFPYLDI